MKTSLYVSFPGNAREALEFYHEVFGGELDIITYGEQLDRGAQSFGGPTAHLGYFREEFVERRKWRSVPESGLKMCCRARRTSVTGFASISASSRAGCRVSVVTAAEPFDNPDDEPRDRDDDERDDGEDKYFLIRDVHGVPPRIVLTV